MIRGEVTGDREVVLGLQRVEEAARGEIRAGIGRITLRLMTQVKSLKLSGQALNVRTGRLRRSITQRIEDSGHDISGIVGTNVEYAAIHEFGFKGQMSVKQHLRQVKQVFGRRLKSPTQALVGAHTRSVDLPARSFLRSALADLNNSGVIQTEIDKSIARALEKAK